MDITRLPFNGINLLIFLCFITTIRSQTPVPYAYEFGKSDPLLVGNRIFDVTEDQEGIIWVATALGALRYNGDKMVRLYQTEDIDQIMIKTFIAEDRKVWFLNISGDLLFADQDSVFPYVWNDSIEHLTRNAYTWDLRMEADGTLHLNTNRRGYFTISKEGILVQHIKPEHYSGLVWLDVFDGPMVVRLPRHNTDSVLNIHFLHQDFTENYALRLLNEPQALDYDQYFDQYYHTLIQNSDTSWHLAYGGKLVIELTRAAKLRHRDLGFVIQEFYIDRFGGQWFSGRDRLGQFYYQNGIFETFKPIVVSKLQSVIRCEDREGGLWLLQDGQSKRIPNPAVQAINVSTGLIERNDLYAISTCDTGVFFSAVQSKHISFLNTSGGNLVQKIEHPEPHSRAPLYSLHYDPHRERLWAGGRGRVWYKNNQESWVSFQDSTLSYIRNKWYQIIPMSEDGRICLVSQARVVIIDGTDKVYTSPYFNDGILDVCPMPSGILWIATRQGMYKVQNGQLFPPDMLDSSFRHSFHSLERMGSKLIAIHKSAGLWIQNGSKLQEVYNDSLCCTDGIPIVQNNNVTLIYNKGMQSVAFNQDTTAIASASFTPYEFPEIPSHFNLLHKHDQKLYLGGQGGLWMFNPKRVKENPLQKARVRFNAIQISGNDTIIRSVYDLKHHQNAIHINYDAVAMPSERRYISYRYKMNDVFNEWKYSEETSVSMAALQPANYVFELQASRGHGFWSESKKVSFNIAIPLWQTWWFLTLVVLGSALLIVWVTFWVITNKREKIRLQLNEIMAEHRALRAQINPHFLFNSMASMQYLVRRNADKASIYIEHLSILIRKTLDHSFMTEVTLESELKLLEKYILLEQLRFQGVFEFSIENDVSENINVMIVPMLLQPYIENAIHHGLRPKGKGGMLTIRCSTIDDKLIIEIRDNGIGRADGIGIKLHEGKSYGMLLSKQRIETINKIDQTASVQIIDLKDTKDQAMGTKVVVTLKKTVKPDESLNSR